MKLTLKDKIILIGACETEEARLKRAINTEKIQAVKEMRGLMLNDLRDIVGRLHNEVVVQEGK